MAEEETRWKPTEEELRAILEQHSLWLISKTSAGKPADLAKANLSKANLVEADLREANLAAANLQGANLRAAYLQKAKLEDTNLEAAYLWGANLQETYLPRGNLQKANLTGANLRDAYLYKANLQEADLDRVEWGQVQNDDASTYDLTGTNFRGANLPRADLRGANFAETNFQDANLTDATLTGGTEFSLYKLAGANLTGAKLSEDLKKFDNLQQVDEASRSTKRIFLVMLLACAYSALTIFSTTDAQLLPNSASSPLPIIGTSIPIAGFFGVAPAILLAIFFYFQLYLQDLWEDLAVLPAVFPDGSPLNKRVFPWLLNGLVQRYLPRLKEHRTAMYPLRVVVSCLLAWWTVPFTIALFWIRYLPRHDWQITLFHVGFLVVAIVFAGWSQGLAKRTVRGHDTSPKTTWARRGGLAALSLTSSLFMLLVSDGALQWKNLDEYGFVKFHRDIVPEALPYILGRANADVTEGEVSTKPENWFLVDTKERTKSVRGAQLSYLDLRGLSGERAFLANAQIRAANLRKAYLLSADLEGAFLFESNLQGAILFRANLQGSNLVNTDLSGANLSEANLAGANLSRANLTAVNLSHANLKDIEVLWPILSIRLANVYGVRDPPEGFVEWAIANGAMCIADRSEWFKLSKKEKVSEAELRAAQKDCFPDKEQEKGKGMSSLVEQP